MAARDSAPILVLSNSASLTSVELPGPCSDESLPGVLDMLGGPTHFASVLDAHQDQPNTVAATPELHLRPDDSFAHPVSGGIVDTNNILLKITKRRRKRPREEHVEGDADGIFQIEHAGTINRTIRFRDMQDYQYAAPLHDPMIQLTEAMRRLDFQALANFTFPEPAEEKPESLHLVPPPVFSRIPLPQWYGFKKNSQTKVEQVINLRGETHDRLANTSRYTTVAPIAISFTSEHVPERPPAGIKEGVGTEASLVARLIELLSERPVWTRHALLNRLSPDHHRNVQYNKQALPFLTYTFSDGPFRELIVRHGYDPRVDSTSRVYQRIQLRVQTEKRSPAKPASAKVKPGPRATGASLDSVNRASHLFDGINLDSTVGTFQLCDLTDPLLHSLVHDARFFRSVCHPIDGWYIANFFDHLRNILKQKFAALQNGDVIEDTDLAGDVERMKALPVEGEGGSGREESEGQAGSDRDSDVNSDTGTNRRRQSNAPKRKEFGKKKKPRPKAKAPEAERVVPEVLKSADFTRETVEPESLEARGQDTVPAPTIET